MNIKKRLYLLIISIFLVIMAGSTGYYIILGGQPTFMDCLYMTVISLTTVGYGEVLEITGNIPAQLYTMFVITFGMGIILYGISTLTAIIIEGEISGILRKKKMLKRIEKLRNHYIVCGGGETGRLVLMELVKNKEAAVLIEREEESIERCRAVDDLLYVQGDATDDEKLFAAGIENATGIIITLPSDKDNLYVTMSARMHNSSVRIICRMIDQKLEPKLKKAGADNVVSPNLIGAMRMASEMIRPTAVYFLDKMLRSSRGDLRVHEITVSGASQHSGKPLKEIGLKKKFDLLVLAVQDQNGELEFNPRPSETLQAGTTLIVMGAVENIVLAKKTLERREANP